MEKVTITLEEIADQMISNSDHSDIDECFKSCYYVVYFDDEKFETWADIDISWEGLEHYRDFLDSDRYWLDNPDTWIEVNFGSLHSGEYTQHDMDDDVGIALSRFDDQETLDNPCFLAAAEDLLEQINDYIDRNHDGWLDWLWETSIDHNPIADEAEAEDWLREFRGDPGYNVPRSLTADELLTYWNDAIEESR